MKVTVQYTTQLRAAVGLAEQTIELQDGVSLAQLLNLLGELHPDVFAQFVWDTGAKRLLPNLILTVNNQQVSDAAGRQLADGDTVTLLSAISGG